MARKYDWGDGKGRVHSRPKRTAEELARAKVRKRNKPPKRISQAEAIRLGSPQAVQAKLSLKPSVWRKVVERAHARGYSVSGYLSNQPDALKERTQEGLRSRAEELIKTAYAPRHAELDHREQQIKALDEKRAADNRYYSEWLATQQQKLQQQAKAADATLDQTLSDAQAATLAAAKDLQQTAQGNMEGSAGNVSQAEGSTASRMLALGQATSNALQAQQQGAIRKDSHSANLRLAEHAAAYLGQMAASDAKRQGETNKAQRELIDDRRVVALEQAADAAKEVARLQDQQIDIADMNRNFDAALEKLDIDREQIKADLIKDQRGYRLERASMRETRRSNRADERVSRAELERKRQADAETRRHNRETERIDEKAARNQRARGESQAERNAQSKAYKQVETALAMLRELHAGKGTPSTFRRKMIAKGVPSPIIDVAEDLRKHNGRLSPRGRMKAKAIGIAHPADYWGRA